MFVVSVLTGANIDPGIWATLPATIITAKVSPIALPIPRITAVIIPGSADGKIIWRIVCQWVDPRPNAASLYSPGTALIASWETDIIVGNIITDKIKAAVNTLNPVPPKCWRTTGTNTVKPKNP